MTVSIPPSSTPSAQAVLPRRTAPPLLNEDVALAKFGRIKKLVMFEAVLIGILGFAVVFLMPFARPIALYYAINPTQQTLQMVGLTMPNMTNRAVLSWAVQSITEIMTMGFGDMDIRLPKEKIRFTPDGWQAYTKAFIEGKIGSQFKQSQLVLTTVPSNTPVIVAQGVNEKEAYQWIVQMPVIMTYATNNNVNSQKRAIVTLTISRIDTVDNPTGIAIDKWSME